MPKAIVLGTGMVGSVIAADLARDDAYEITIVDRCEQALQAAASRVKRISGRDIKTQCQDLSDPNAIAALVKPFDIVLGAVGSPIGFQTLRAVIEAGVNFCDICFMPEDAIDLDELAKKHNVTAVVDCGVAPGMSNMMAGYAAAKLDRCDEIEIYVGGLPRERHWPFEYKAGFSPYDVIEEYTRPSRIVEHGKTVIRPALSEPELIEFDGIGSLEAFNTDGLRSIADTLDVPFMKEKTLRYPGHIELMRVFRETGLFSHEPVDVQGQMVRPIDVIQALLFPKWTYEQHEEDLTVMRVLARGEQDGKATTYSWDLLDFFDTQTSCSSMSRTTAFPCSIMARMVAEGRFNEKGVIVPELIGRHEDVFNAVLAALLERGVQYDAKVTQTD